MQIIPVRTKRDLRAFIQFPYDFYRDDPVWVPPLRSEQWSQFDSQKNPMLDHCETELILLKEGDQVIGRCSAFIDRLAVAHWEEPIGLFGSFECVEDEGAAPSAAGQGARLAAGAGDEGYAGALELCLTGVGSGN